jgi:hypothetical protein
VLCYRYIDIDTVMFVCLLIVLVLVLVRWECRKSKEECVRKSDRMLGVK